MPTATDLIFLSAPIPHATNGASTQGTAIASFSATSAASYVVTGTGSHTASLSTSVPCVSQVTVANHSTTAIVFVLVGRTDAVPPSPSTGSPAGSFAVFPLSNQTFQIPGAGIIGGQGLVKCAASAEGVAMSVNWHR